MGQQVLKTFICSSVIIHIIVAINLEDKSIFEDGDIQNQGQYLDHHKYINFNDHAPITTKNVLPPKVIKITRTVAIKVPVPYPVKIFHSVPYPVPVAKPYPVHIPKFIKIQEQIPFPVQTHETTDSFKNPPNDFITLETTGDGNMYSISHEVPSYDPRSEVKEDLSSSNQYSDISYRIENYANSVNVQSDNDHQL